LVIRGLAAAAELKLEGRNGDGLMLAILRGREAAAELKSAGRVMVTA
jgi:hypothetical protein